LLLIIKNESATDTLMHDEFIWRCSAIHFNSHYYCY